MPLILGHRGASAAAPENTVEAFRLALSMGADGVELDVRPGARLSVQHDVGDVPGAPTLTEALDACRGSFVNVELKNLQGEPDFDEAEGLSDAVVALLRARGGDDDVLVSSFNLAAINRVKELAPDVRTGFLVMIAPGGDLAGRVIDRAKRHGHDAIHPHHLAVDAAFMDLARAASLDVHTWTVDHPDRMRDLADLGVTSIITNVPDVAVATLRAT
ncbi:MAG TPA: glycerophosphodiester phosphodiesterase [Acidimicrobiales bacterium]|nr:glycerophosphodiester phosphodiesterase [Acidimicrobiales bacterium]